TITTFHNARFMSHPATENCVVDGNLLHAEQLTIVAMLGRILAVNTVIDERRAVLLVNYGEGGASHAPPGPVVHRPGRGARRGPVGERFGTVVTSAAGYPLDKTYYQTVKGMVAPLDILEPGGTLIVASECSEGMGSREFVDAQRRLIRLGADGFYGEIRDKPF